MWTDFVECPDAVPASTQTGFTTRLMQYLKDQPNLFGLLRYLPSESLVRIHLGEDKRLHLTAIHVPQDSILFKPRSMESVNLGQGVHRREEFKWDTEAMQRKRTLALAFFLTEPDDTVIARRGQTKLTPLEHAFLFDLTDTNRFTCSACFPVEELDFNWLQSLAD